MNTCPKEIDEQINFIRYCKTIGVRAVSTQNGMYINKQNFNGYAYIRKAKASGLSKGFPDLLILAPNKSKTQNILFIEMKRKKGGSLKPEQKDWIYWLDQMGYCVGIAKGCDHAIEILEKYLKS